MTVYDFTVDGLRWTVNITRYTKGVTHFTQSGSRYIKDVTHYTKGVCLVNEPCSDYTKGISRYTLNVTRYTKDVSRYNVLCNDYTKGVYLKLTGDFLRVILLDQFVFLNIFDAFQHAFFMTGQRFSPVERHFIIHLPTWKMAGVTTTLQDRHDLRRKTYRVFHGRICR